MTDYIGDDSNNTFTGGSGSDTFIGRGGNDTLTGGGGSDTFKYDTRQFGADVIKDFVAGAGGDRIDLSFLKVADLASLTPFMTEDNGNVLIKLGYNSWTESILIENTTIAQLTAANFVFNTSSDVVNTTGTGYRDVLFGGNANDILRGGDGNDTLVGGVGNDTLTGGGDEDTLRGGGGSDTFDYNSRQFGADVIKDFTAGAGGDRIDLSFLKVADLASLTPFMTEDNGNVLIKLGYNSWTESILIENTTIAQLTAANFVFNTSSDVVNTTGTGYRDVLFGGNANDILRGGDGNDSLVGGANSDTITGGGDDDTLRGGGGSDTFVYNSRQFGADVIKDFTAGAGGDRIDLSFLKVADLASLTPFMTEDNGNVLIKLGYNSWTESILIENTTIAQLTAANFVFNTSPDVINTTGTGYRDVLFGGSANDILRGGDGDDTIVGGANSDTITGGGDDDTLRGGSGSDTFVYNSRQFGDDVIKDFTRGAGGDKIDLSFLKVADLASLTPFMEEVDGGVVITLGYNSWSETIRIENTTIAQLTAANFVFNASSDVVNTTGTGYRDVLFGGNATDSLSGGDGNDSLAGGAGDDVLRGGTGSDRFFGGTGNDTVTYFGTDGAVTVNLATGVGSSGEAQGDTFNGVENVYGGKAGDTLTGNAGANILKGYDGNDQLAGGDGNDILNGGTGGDSINGGAGIDLGTYFDSAVGVTVNLAAGTGSGGTAHGDTLAAVEAVNGSTHADTLIGSSAANTLRGGDGNDFLRGGAGADVLDGGAGVDTVSYTDSAKGVTVNLAAGTGSGGTATGDTLLSIESVNGSSYADTLIGNSVANALTGAGGKDVLTGGAGSDRFVFGAGHSATGSANADRITDFSHAQGDRIDLSLIDANTGAAGNQAFSFIGTEAYTGVAGQLRYVVSNGDAVIAGDTDGDKVSDFNIVLDNIGSLQASDFVL
ncbi:calcium-binding protein [Inquilinus sp. Marseille-Q2685]|uniref:beta strand repeat-containing protein n=1 Tax=Inquilinus sp. Marseille-Q2685 TaxID=2866581 RepID=UPI001CE47EE4|nr:calcium-binding protein [Inquilinus sp. Marseille-Q2685]